MEWRENYWIFITKLERKRFIFFISYHSTVFMHICSITWCFPCCFDECNQLQQKILDVIATDWRWFKWLCIAFTWRSVNWTVAHSQQTVLLFSLTLSHHILVALLVTSWMAYKCECSRANAQLFGLVWCSWEMKHIAATDYMVIWPHSMALTHLSTHKSWVYSHALIIWMGNIKGRIKKTHRERERRENF